MEEKEIWKSIEGYDGIYEISNLGKVKRLPNRIWIQRKRGAYYKNISERILKPVFISNKYGYSSHTVVLCHQGISKSFRLSRLVANAFLPNPNNLKYVIHKNGNTIDDRAENLVWASTMRDTHRCINKLYDTNTTPPDNRELLSKPIRCIELNRVYKSITDARKKGYTDVSRALKFGTKAGGYHWEYVKT